MPTFDEISQRRYRLASHSLFSDWTGAYGKPCGSKIESTKRTVIMPIIYRHNNSTFCAFYFYSINVRVLAINVRVFYKRTCFIINVRVSL